jgi:exopolysaccharide biosynthesis polyprenyl glycosylphosphotransferase
VLFDAGALLLGCALWSQWQARPVALLYTAVALALIAISGRHRPGINPRMSDDLPILLGLLAAAAILVAPLAGNDEDIAGFVRFVPVVAVLFVAFRAVACKLIREARAHGLVVDRVLIVGAGERGTELAAVLRKHPEYGLEPVGFVDRFDESDLALPVLGRADQIADLIAEHGVRRLIVAFGGTPEPELIRRFRDLDHLPVEIHVVPRFFELGGVASKRGADDVWGIPLIHLRRSALRSVAWRLKRVLDVVASSLLIMAFSPVMLACVIGVRLSSPGPVLFRQKRVGQRGELFELLKFRSMRENDASDTQWSSSEGDLMTPFGRFMRKTGIDELPQLFNVLSGAMSLVGPRPERPYFADQFSIEVDGYAARHRVPAGLTGWAQVHGLRGDSSITQRAMFDNNYIEHWSLWHDVVILARTTVTVLRGQGA